MWTWTWQVLLSVSLVSGLALDSNTIRSSKETSSASDGSHGDRVQQSRRRHTETNVNSNRRQTPPPCSSADCYTPERGGCSNRAQRRPAARDRAADAALDGDAERFNRTKAPEMASCVRSGDCAAGLCCVRYLTGKRCQRIPTEGEACLLRSASKRRRNLGRCDCAAGLTCAAAEPGSHKGQGVCVPRPRHAQRKTRHSGKKRRTAERSC